MSKLEYTPGPWKAGYINKKGETWTTEGLEFQISDSHGNSVAQIDVSDSDTKTDECDIVNLKLMAESPEMYEILRKLIKSEDTADRELYVKTLNEAEELMKRLEEPV